MRGDSAYNERLPWRWCFELSFYLAEDRERLTRVSGAMLRDAQAARSELVRRGYVGRA